MPFMPADEKQLPITQTGGASGSMATLMSGNVDGAMVNPVNNVILREKGFRETVGPKQL